MLVEILDGDGNVIESREIDVQDGNTHVTIDYVATSATTTLRFSNPSFTAGDGSSSDMYLDDIQHYAGVSGADTIDGGTGDDTIYAADNDDVIKINDTFGNDTIAGGETGETDGDTLDASGSTADSR